MGFFDTTEGHALASVLTEYLPELVEMKLQKPQKQFHYVKNIETSSSDIIGWIHAETDGRVRFVTQIDNMLIFEADRDENTDKLTVSVKEHFNMDRGWQHA